MSTSIQTVSASRQGRSVHTPAQGQLISMSEIGPVTQNHIRIQPVQISQQSQTIKVSQIPRSAGFLETELFIQLPASGKSNQPTSCNNLAQHSEKKSTRNNPIHSCPVSRAHQLLRPRALDACSRPMRGFFFQGKFGPLPPSIKLRDRPSVDFSVGLRRHDLPPREEVNWFAKALPVIDRSNYTRFYATQMFSLRFLKAFLKVDLKACGEVDPYLCPDTKMPMYPRTIWLLEVSKQLHLPHTVGAHGLMIQKGRPIKTNKIVPLFIGEHGPMTSWWYAGEYQVDDGEIFAPITKKYKKSMEEWSERFAERSIEKEKEDAKWNHVRKSQRKNTMYKRMLPKNGQPPEMPYYIRRLIFKEFNQQFYQDLCSANRMFMS